MLEQLKQATESLDKALDISFKSGAITGFLVVGFGLLGLLDIIGFYSSSLVKLKEERLLKQ